MNNQITIRLKRKLSDFILSKNNNSNITNDNINNNNLNSNIKPKKRLNLSNPENHKIKSNSVIHIKSKTISFYDNDDNIYNKYIKKKNENKKLPFYINNYFYKQKISGGKIDLYNYDKNKIKIIKKINKKDEKIIYIQKIIKGFLYRKIFKKIYNFLEYFKNYIMKINKSNFLFFINNIKKLYYNNSDNKKIVQIYKNNINNINIKEYINKNFKIKFNNNINNDNLKSNYNSNNNNNNNKNIKKKESIKYKNLYNIAMEKCIKLEKELKEKKFQNLKVISLVNQKINFNNYYKNNNNNNNNIILIKENLNSFSLNNTKKINSNFKIEKLISFNLDNKKIYKNNLNNNLKNSLEKNNYTNINKNNNNLNNYSINYSESFYINNKNNKINTNIKKNILNSNVVKSLSFYLIKNYIQKNIKKKIYVIIIKYLINKSKIYLLKSIFKNYFKKFLKFYFKKFFIFFIYDKILSSFKKKTFLFDNVIISPIFNRTLKTNFINNNNNINLNKNKKKLNFDEEINEKFLNKSFSYNNTKLNKILNDNSFDENDDEFINIKNKYNNINISEPNENINNLEDNKFIKKKLDRILKIKYKHKRNHSVPLNKSIQLKKMKIIFYNFNNNNQILFKKKYFSFRNKFYLNKYFHIWKNYTNKIIYKTKFMKFFLIYLIYKINSIKIIENQIKNNKNLLIGLSLYYWYKKTKI